MSPNNSDNNHSTNITTNTIATAVPTAPITDFSLSMPNSTFPNNEINPNNAQPINMMSLKNEAIDNTTDFMSNIVENTNSLVLDTTNHLNSSEALQFTQQPLSTTQVPLPSNTNSNSTTHTNTSINSLSVPKKKKSHVTISTKSGPTSHTITTFSSNKPSSNEFVRKLFHILENNAYPEIVRWTDDGDSFVVIDTGKFTSQILPNHFKHSNFASFVRQLNKYDFHKVKRKQDEKSKYGDLSWEFKHPLFKKQYPSGLDNIRRKVSVSKKDSNTNSNSSNNTNNSSDPNSSNHVKTNNMNISNDFVILTEKQREKLLQNTVSKDSFHNLRSKVTRLENELKMSKEETNNLKNEIDRMTTRYTTLLESLIAFKTVHENLTSNFNTLCSILVNRGVNIPQNLYNNNTINQKSPQYKNPGGSTLSNQGSMQNSTSPIQVINQQAILKNIDNQIPTMNNSANDMLVPIASGNNHNLQMPENESMNSNRSISMNPIDINNVENNKNNNIINQHNSKLNTPSNINSNNIINNDNNNNNIPVNTNDVALRKGFHVLLVEDDTVSIQLCSKFLRKYGCTVEVVTDGLSAISTLEKFKYDLVLMDIVMPNLDGATATSIVRNFDKQTPIIAMTGNIDDQDLLTYLQHGMNDVLAKPFTRNDLHSMLVRHLKDRIPLCEQKMNSPINNQLSSNVLQKSQNMQNTPQLEQDASMSPTLPTSMISQPQQLHDYSVPPTLQPSIPMALQNTSHVLSHAGPQVINKHPTVFDIEQPISKKPRV